MSQAAPLNDCGGVPRRVAVSWDPAAFVPAFWRAILIAGATVIDEMVTHGIHNGARDGVSWMFGIAREI